MENKLINIAEILKDAPKGTRLYSPVCGELELYAAHGTHIECTAPGYYNDLDFDSYGRIFHYSDLEEAECLLFPAKENRDWSTFQAPREHKEFKAGEKVIVPYYDVVSCRTKWKLDIYSHYDSNIEFHVMVSGDKYADDEIRRYDGNTKILGAYVKD